MALTLNIQSEIGRLKKVLVHRPGKELENLCPENLEELLFEDIPFLEKAKQEHDGFTKVMRNLGVQVYYIEDLLKDILAEEEKKILFLNNFLKESNIFSKNLREVINNKLLSMPLENMIEFLFSGLKKEDLDSPLPTSLKEFIEENRLFYINPLPNLYFTRDPAAVIGNGISINKMYSTARQRESLFIEYIMEHHQFFKNQFKSKLYSSKATFSIEGGDQLVISKDTLVIGCSERTKAEAIENFSREVFNNLPQITTVLIFNIPSVRAFMHLDTVFTMIDYDKFTIHPGIEDSLRIYEITRGKAGEPKIRSREEDLKIVLKEKLNLDYIDIIKCGGGDRVIAGREQWNDGSNTLAIMPGVIITYERNYITNELLDKKGVKVIPIDSSELSRGRGGPRCMSMPLLREEI